MTSRHSETWVGQALWTPAFQPPSHHWPCLQARFLLSMIRQDDQPTPPRGSSPQVILIPNQRRTIAWPSSPMFGQQLLLLVSLARLPKHIFLHVLHSRGVYFKVACP